VHPDRSDDEWHEMWWEIQPTLIMKIKKNFFKGK